jgi:hypothetical protein
MSEDGPAIDHALKQGLERLACADLAEEIESTIATHPLLADKAFLERLDHLIDDPRPPLAANA